MFKKTVHASRRIVNQFTRSNWRKVIWYIRSYGFGRFLSKAAEKISFFASFNQEYAFDDEGAYKRWIVRNEPTETQLATQSKHKFKYQPKISIIVPTYNTPPEFLRPMIESVRSQTYTNWELCVADSSSQEETREHLRQITGKDKRIKVRYLKTNQGIAGNSNEAIKLATGEYVALLDHDDTLAPFALYEVVAALNRDPEADLLYSDEDKLSENGRARLKPHFKPDWSPDTLRSHNYITHLLVVKRRFLNKIGYIRKGFEGSQDFDLILRATEKAQKIKHVPKVLYHWREHANSTALNTKSKSYVSYSTKRAVADHLNRLKLRGRVVDGPFFATCRVIFDLPTPLPLVSIIIPTKDQAVLLQRCLESIINRSTYLNYEIILIDTGSKESQTRQLYLGLKKYPQIKIFEWHKPFNYSTVNNFATKKAQGDYLLFLNNDTEVISSDWIESMLEYAQRPDVGAVGAKLIYPDETVQHGGVILGMGGVAGHAHRLLPSDSFGYFGRLALPRNLSAVTAACIMIPRKIFEAVDGFDELYPLAFNDTDLCLKIRQIDKLVVWTPYAQLYHYESKTRGLEDTAEKKARLQGEVDRFYSKWGAELKRGDPYYNSNLTLARTDFSLRMELDPTSNQSS